MREMSSADDLPKFHGATSLNLRTQLPLLAVPDAAPSASKHKGTARTEFSGPERPRA